MHDSRELALVQLNPDGTPMQMEGGMDGQGNLAPTLVPGMHMSAMMSADGTPLPAGDGGTPGDQGIMGGTPKTGKSSARRSHTRWTEGETMRLIDGARSRAPLLHLPHRLPMPAT